MMDYLLGAFVSSKPVLTDTGTGCSGSREMDIRAFPRRFIGRTLTPASLNPPIHLSVRVGQNVDRATFNAHAHMTATGAAEGRPGLVLNNCAPQGWASDDKLEHRAAASWNSHTVFDF